MTDNEFLYIASITECISDSIKAAHSERDSDVYADDAIGFLISGEENVLYQFYVNSNGVIWDKKSDFALNTHDKDWNGDFDITTKVFENYWVTEIKIPLAELNIDENTSELRFNYCQYRQYDQQAAYFQPEWGYDSVRNGTIIILKR